MSLVFGHPYAQALAWSLIHFVWQGAAIALALMVIQRVTRMSASARYTSGVVAMALMLAAPAITFVTLSADAAQFPTSVVGSVATTGSFTGTASVVGPALTAESLPASDTLISTVILVIWSVGVVALSLRLLGGWIVARRLARRTLAPASAEIQALARRVAGRLALDRVVGVFESSAVTVPVMIGWMKPVVLLPAAAMAGLSLAQVEALLAHELAHVRRHDYLVNLLQSAVETLLFYHPAVWFVSRRMRVDRELCCDDLAVDICDRVAYARALSDLAAMATPKVALAATDGPLLNRVRRILGQPADGPDRASGWLSMCFVVMLAGSIAPVALTQKPATPASDTQKPAIEKSVPKPSPDDWQIVDADRTSSEEKWKIVDSDQTPVEKSKPERVQTEEQRRIEAQLRELEAQRQALAEARLDNELRKKQAQSEARIVEQQAQMNALRAEYDRVRKAAEAGVVGPTTVADIEAKMMVVEQQLKSERVEMDFMKTDMELRKRELALEREALVHQKRLTTEVPVEAVEAKQKLEMEEIAKVLDDARRLNAKVGESKLREDIDRMLLMQKSMEAQNLDYARLQEVLKKFGQQLGENETAQAGDIVNIVMPGEPDMPQTFKVQNDGTIRFPLLGSIRVQGLTAKQVQDAVAKQFNRLNLATPEMHVTLRRVSGR